MRIENWTPHDVNVLGEDGMLIRSIPSNGVARLKVSVVWETDIGGVPISRCEFGEPENLPEQQTGIFLIVSQLVKAALPQRTDLLVPAELVRDSDGRIIGCRSLSR